MQDEWRVRPGLTVNAGLRYEYELLPLPQQPNPALDAAFGQTGATSVFPEDRNNFGPRVGVAWEPFGSGRGMVRVGYGLYYGRLPGATMRSALVNTALPSSTTRCADLAYYGYRLSAGGEPGVRVCVRVRDDAAGGGGEDDFGDGVRSQVSAADGAAGQLRDGARGGWRNGRECDISDESRPAVAELGGHQHCSFDGDESSFSCRVGRARWGFRMARRLWCRFIRSG